VLISSLRHNPMQVAGSKLKVNVLCPSLVKTAIADSNRHRPAHLASANPNSAPFDQRVRAGMEASDVSAADVARITMQAICDDDCYILPHPAVRLRVEERLRDIISDPRHHKPDNLSTTTDGP